MVRKNCLLVCGVFWLSGIASAADYTWTNAAGGNFVGNFTPGGTPMSAIDTTLIFPDLLALPTGYTAVNNLGSFTLNAIQFDSFASPNPAAVTISAGAAAGFTLRFAANGAIQPSILQNGTGAVVIQNGLATTGITLIDGTNLTIGGSGLGSLLLSATIGQAAGGIGAVTYNSTAPFTFGNGSTVTVSGANTYTGGTSIVSGNLVVSNNSAFGTGPVTINGAEHSLRVSSSAISIANPLVLNQSLRLASSGGNATFSGAVSGPGGLTLDSIFRAGSNSYTFTGPGTATGPVNMAADHEFGFTLAFAGPNGRTRYSSFVVGPRSELRFDNSSGTTTRLNAAIPPPLTLRSGTVTILGQPSSGNSASETFGTLTAAGSSTLIATPGTIGTAALRFAGLTRELNATLDFRGTNLGGSGSNSANFLFTSDPGGAIGGILPYAVASTSATATSRTLARYDAPTGKIVPLNVATDFNPVDLYVAGQTNPGANIRRAGTVAAPNAGSVAGLVGAVAVNAIVLEKTSLSGSATLTVAGGSVVQTTPDASTSIGYLNLGGLNFGANPGYIHGSADQFINAPIFGAGGVVKSGDGTLTLAAANTFSGGLTINAGIVAFSADAALGHSAGGVTLNATNSLPSGTDPTPGLAFSQDPFVDPSQAITLTTTRPITVGPIGGGLIPAIVNGTWTIAGPISGSGPLKIGTGFGSSGVVVLSGSNSNSGGLVVTRGALAVASDAALGAPTSSLQLSDTLRVDGSFTTARPMDFFGTVVLPAGRSLQLDGPVTGRGLSVVGAGEFTLTSTSLLTGGVSVGDLTPTSRVAMPAGTPSGATLTVRGPNGALPLVGQFNGSFRVSQAGTLHLDNSGPAGNANSNRVGGAGILLSGGEWKLTGNAALDLTETTGNLTSDRLLGTVTLVQPDSGGIGRQTAMVTPGYFHGSSATLRDVLFVRGTNLGASTGDRTALLLNTDPVPVNGLIEGAVVATSAVGSPTDFAAATPVGSQFAVTPFTAYAGQTPASGGATTATYDNTAVTLFTGNVAANALRLSAGGGVQMNPGTSLSLETGMILALPSNDGIRGGTLTTTKPLRVVNTGNLTIGSAAEPTTVNANNGFVKAGAGALTLFGTASTTLGSVTGNRATVTVAEGTLALGNAQGLVNSTVNGVTGVLPDFTLGASAALDLSALPNPVRVRSISGYGSVHIGSGALQVGDQVGAFGGSLVGTAAANFIVGAPQAEAAGNTYGEGITTLSGDNSGYAGAFTVLRGTLALASSHSAGSGTSPVVLGDTSGAGQAQLSLGSVLSFTRDITVRAGAAPTNPHALLGGGATPNALADNATQTVSGNIALGQSLQLGNATGTTHPLVFFTGTVSGPGSLRQTGMDAIFTGNNTFSGGFDTTGMSVIGLGSNSTPTTGPLGTGPVRVNSRGAFLAYGGPRTLSNPVVMTGTTPLFYLSVTGLHDLTFTGSFDYSAITQPVQIRSQSVGVTTFAGPVIGSRQLQKTGVGTVVFANPTGNSYVGGTIVDAGTLIAANTTGSATGAGAVTVNPGAILGGAGNVAGETTFTSGSILRPGANETTPGTLTIGGNVTMQNRAILSVTIDGSMGGKLQLGGGFFDLTGANSLSVHVTGSAPATPESYTIVDSGAIPIAFFNGTFSASNFTVSASFPFSSLSLTNPTTTTLVLHYVPVPEPTGILFVVAVTAWTIRRFGHRAARRNEIC